MTDLELKRRNRRESNQIQKTQEGMVSVATVTHDEKWSKIFYPRTKTCCISWACLLRRQQAKKPATWQKSLVFASFFKFFMYEIFGFRSVNRTNISLGNMGFINILATLATKSYTTICKLEKRAKVSNKCIDALFQAYMNHTNSTYINLDWGVTQVMQSRLMCTKQ